MTKRARTPKPDCVKVAFEAYGNSGLGDVTRAVRKDVEDRYGRATVARVTIEGPHGEKASAFLTVHWDGRTWRAEVDHDATDYSTDHTTYRRAGVPLRFFANA